MRGIAPTSRSRHKATYFQPVDNHERGNWIPPLCHPPLSLSKDAARLSPYITTDCIYPRCVVSAPLFDYIYLAVNACISICLLQRSLFFIEHILGDVRSLAIFGILQSFVFVACTHEFVHFSSLLSISDAYFSVEIHLQLRFVYNCIALLLLLTYSSVWNIALFPSFYSSHSSLPSSPVCYRCFRFGLRLP